MRQPLSIYVNLAKPMHVTYMHRKNRCT